jgi:hypothetical protein
MSIAVLGVVRGGRGLGRVSWNNIKIYKNRTLFVILVNVLLDKSYQDSF